MHIKKRMTIMSLVLGAAAIGVAAGVGIPSVLAIQKTVGEISEAQSRLDERYALNRLLSQARDDIEANKRRVAPLSVASIKEAGELDFVSAIEQAALATRVKQKLTLETSAQRELSAWEREIPVTISASGEFRNVMAFVNALERMPYLLDIGSVTISAGVSGPVDGPGAASFEIHALAFWIGASAPEFVTGKPPAAAPAAAPAAKPDENAQ